jgi:hypothetical protein
MTLIDGLLLDSGFLKEALVYLTIYGRIVGLLVNDELEGVLILSRYTDCPDHGFSQSLHTSAGTDLILGDDQFRP